MRFLVTGGAGRLGSEVVRLGAERGHEIVAFDLPQARWENVSEIPGVEAFKGDVTDAENVGDACRGVNGVIHLAAILPPASEAKRKLTMKVNVEGTRTITESLRRSRGKPIVFASSVSTYGITAQEEPPIGEGHPLRVHNNYSESKIESERLIIDSGIPHTVLRIAPIAVADIVELPETIPYRADQRVEFIFVVDAACAALSVLEEPSSRGKTYNIAGGPTWQMTGAEYIEGFYGALGVEVESIFSDEYTAADWYDTKRGGFLGYQRTTFNDLLEMLRVLGEELGLR
ncbi:MAG: NAD(P)-dependent oxidoreductase [Candidatus Bathyarchaeota archaeon]|nr:NAD(P)-dependent oxidoreductase [Candidatus Bathyarchaeota archaeon]